MTDLKQLGAGELEAWAQDAGQPAYRGRQLFEWLFAKRAESFESMSNLPAGFRAYLAEHARISGLELVKRQTAGDGTVKCLFALETGRLVESVLIPDFDDEGSARRLTVCVSSQVGCAMGCTFCATGRMGFRQNLHAGEIFDQVAALDHLARDRFGRGVSNVVFMGMGEPLQNYDAVVRSVDLLRAGLDLSPRRITISTVGLARRIRQLADDGCPANLAVSLHAPEDEKRSSIMPVNRSERTDLGALRDAIRHHAGVTGRPVTYEYCMFAGFNDSQEDARHLADVARWAPSKVNLIMYNPVPGTGFEPTPPDRLDAFIATLVDAGVRVTVRRSRGQDIDAACGQLATRESSS